MVTDCISVKAAIINLATQQVLSVIESVRISPGKGAGLAMLIIAWASAECFGFNFPLIYFEAFVNWGKRTGLL